MAISRSSAAAQLRALADQLEAGGDTQAGSAAPDQTAGIAGEGGPTQAQVATGGNAADQLQTVTVQEEQTLAEVAGKIGVELEALHAFNAGLLGSNPHAPVAPGTVLSVPPQAAATASADSATSATPAAGSSSSTPAVDEGDTAGFTAADTAPVAAEQQAASSGPEASSGNG